MLISYITSAGLARRLLVLIGLPPPKCFVYGGEVPNDTSCWPMEGRGLIFVVGEAP